MSVYKEFFAGVQTIQNNSNRICNDACDYGAITKKGDEVWNTMKMLADMYGVKNTRKIDKYTTGSTVEIELIGIDEWAVSDERKTLKEATIKLKMIFVAYTTSKFKGFDGYVYLEQI